MKKYIIDRFEENFAVLEKEEGGTVDVERHLLPGAKKGDVIIEKDGKYFVDEKLTKERKAAIAEKVRRLLGKN